MGVKKKFKKVIFGTAMMFIMQWLFNWVKKRVSNFSLSGFYNDLSFSVAWGKRLKSDRYNVNV